MGWIPLSKGLWAEVDDEDVEWLSEHKWCAKQGGAGGQCYAARTVRENGGFRTIRMHREITNCPVGMEADHLDGDALNNHKSNLEVCTRKENMRRRWNRKKYTST